MKRKIYIIYAFLGMTFTGCDNILDSTPAVTISEDLFWQTEDDAEKAIIGVYGPLWTNIILQDIPNRYGMYKVMIYIVPETGETMPSSNIQC